MMFTSWRTTLGAIHEKYLQSDVVSYSAAISAFEKCQCCRQALVQLYMVHSGGQKLDAIKELGSEKMSFGIKARF